MNTKLTRWFTPENITELNDNEIFVFGSNLNGDHAGGAAKYALDHFGAINGNGEGIQGKSYAIPTLDKLMQKISLEDISKSIDTFYEYAEENADLEFWVTKIGCGIAGFTIEEIAPIFKSKETPFNVYLPKEFSLIKGVKAFNKGMKCRGFQYEENKEFVHDGNVSACNSGFHFCENPLDVFKYYNANSSEFAGVEGHGDLDSENKDSKVSVSRLKINAKIKLPFLIKSGIDFTFKKSSFLRKRAERLADKNSGRDYSVNSGRDYSVNSGQDSSVNSGQHYSVNSGRDYSVNSGQDSSVNSGQHYSVNSGQNSSVNSGRDYSVNSGQDSSVNSGQHYSVNSGQHYSVNSGQHSSVNSGRDYSVNSGQDSSVNSGQDSSVNSGQHSSVNSGQNSSVNSGRDYSVNSGQDSSVNSGQHYSVNSGQHSSVNSGRDYSVNSGRDYSVNSGRDYSVNSGRNYSVNSGQHSSVCAGRHYSTINLDGKNSFGIAGKGSKIKGKKGCAICLVEHDLACNIIGVKSALIDGVILKEDIYYKLENGEFIEVED